HTGRLVVRRVRDRSRTQDELFPVWRYHAFFTDTALSTVDADLTHRQHAVVETVFSDLIDGPLAHLPFLIFSLLIDHGVELGGCVVDGVGDVGRRRLRSARSDEFCGTAVGRVATIG